MSNEGTPPPENDNEKPPQLPAVIGSREISSEGTESKETPAQSSEAVTPLTNERVIAPHSETEEQVRVTSELLRETKERLRRNAEEARLRAARRRGRQIAESAAQSRTEGARAKESNSNESRETNKAEAGAEKAGEGVREKLNVEKTKVPEKGSTKEGRKWKEMFTKENVVTAAKRAGGLGAVVGLTAAGLWAGGEAAGYIASELGFTAPALASAGVGAGLTSFLGPILGAVAVDFVAWRLLKALWEQGGGYWAEEYFGWMGLKGSGGVAKKKSGGTASHAPAAASHGAGGH